MASAVVEERGLALWSGSESDFGVSLARSTERLTVRSTTSIRTLSFDSHERPTFEQFEVLRSLVHGESLFLTGGGGIRHEWDGTQLLIGRLVAGTAIGSGQLEGSVVVERALTSLRRRDAADLITTIGWSHQVGARVSLGMEGIGQDLEGFWNPAEADGGAKLLVGPSFHAQSKRGDWTATFTAGPVFHTASLAPSPETPAMAASAGGHLGIFASATWSPALR
jgi:hypothetical protein